MLVLMKLWSVCPSGFSNLLCAALAIAGKGWLGVKPPGSWRGEGHCGMVSPSLEPWGLSCLPAPPGKPASFPLLTWKCSFPVQTC